MPGLLAPDKVERQSVLPLDLPLALGDLKPEPSRNWFIPTYWVLAFLIIGISLWQGAGKRYLNFENPAVDIVNLQAVDVDYHVLYPSLQAKKSFGETFNWWREPWRADEWVGAYWRPLTMQSWWLQSRIFGEDRPNNWMRVSLVLAIAFSLLLLQFFRTLTGNKWIALAGLALFALPPHWYQWANPLGELPRVANADLMIVKGWKDQPDLWANSFILGTLILSLKRNYGWALACAGIAIAFKESGLMTFPLVAILALTRGELRRIPWWAYFVSALTLLLMMYGRWLAGPLVFQFHSYGGDGGAFTRYSNALFPLSFGALSSFGLALAAIGIFALTIWRPKSLLLCTALVIAIFSAAVGLIAIQRGLTLDVALADFILLGAVPSFLLLAWLLLARVVWRQKQFLRTAIALAACAYISAIPFALATQAALHCLALSRSLLAGYAACALFAIGAAVVKRLKELRPVYAYP